MTIRFGATEAEWDHFDLVLGLTADLLPVVSNPHALISPNSKLKALGKVPSLYNASDVVIGIKDWTSKVTTRNDITKWKCFADYGICVQTRLVRAIDVDVNDLEKANAILKLFEGLGWPCRRRRSSGKFLLIFEMKGEFAKRALPVDGGNIEFLANGQQFIACGTHPSGEKYEWVDGLPKWAPPVAQDKFEEFWLWLADEIGTAPSSAGSLRRADAERASVALDRTGQWLTKNNLVIGVDTDNELQIVCPFKSGHSIESGPSETVYFNAGSRGYAEGHFKCMHASCLGRSDDDFKRELGYWADLFDEVPVEAGVDDIDALTKKTSPYAVHDANTARKRQPSDWLIKGIIPRGKLILAFGGSGDGKSFVVLDMLAAITRGVTWNDRKVEKGRAVYICAEGAGGFPSRLEAYAREHGVDFTDFGLIEAAPNFRAAVDVRAVATEINKWGKTDIVAVDTFAQVTAGADENAGKDIGLALKNCELLHELTGATVFLIHHAGKDPTRGARGWSGIKAPLDAEFEISKLQGNLRQFWVTKMKDGRDNFGWQFQLVEIPVGMDKDGDVIESCFVRFTGISVQPVVEKKQVLSPSHQRVMQAWQKLGGNTIEVEKVAIEAARSIPRGDETKKDRRVEYARITISNMAAKGLLAVCDEMLLAEGVDILSPVNEY